MAERPDKLIEPHTDTDGVDKHERPCDESLHTTHVEMLSGRKKKDDEAQAAADALENQAGTLDEEPGRPDPCGARRGLTDAGRPVLSRAARTSDQADSWRMNSRRTRPRARHISVRVALSVRPMAVAISRPE